MCVLIFCVCCSVVQNLLVIIFTINFCACIYIYIYVCLCPFVCVYDLCFIQIWLKFIFKFFP